MRHSGGKGAGVEEDCVSSCCPRSPRALLPQDTLQRGVRLNCGSAAHIYCEACIQEWLERNTTCPLCRKQVKAPDAALPSASAQATSSVLPVLF